MYVGALRVRLMVRESRSLKDKRQVVRSIVDKLRANFHVAAGEVDDLDDHRLATIGIAAVGGESEPIRALLEQLRDQLRKHPIAEFLEGSLEVLPVTE